MEVGISSSFPWLLGMVGLFALEFIEGNTITRLYFMRLRRLTRSALDAGEVTPELQQARGEHVPTFMHFLDLPLLFLIIALGAVRPTTWLLFLAGLVAAVTLAIILTLVIPRLYPRGSEELSAFRSGLATDISRASASVPLYTPKQVAWLRAPLEKFYQAPSTWELAVCCFGSVLARSPREPLTK